MKDGNDDIYIACVLCNDVITNMYDLYHVTAVVEGELNTHTHLCQQCFHESIKSIPVLRKK